jgi:colanic acid/amylovoran biosynthesis glycosyltransferase
MADTPLRIGLLVDQFPELSETFIAAEARELVALGHRVRVESNAHAPEPNAVAARGLEVAYRVDDERARRARDLVWLVARHPLAALRDLAGRRRWRREEPAPALRELAPVARRLAGFGAAHLHAHFAAGAALDALRLSALLGVPYSVMSHGYDIFSLPRNLREKHERAAFAVTACEYSARYLREQHAVDGAQPLVVGVDAGAFTRRRSHSDGRTLIAVARLVEKKGIDVLIEAAGLLKQRAPLERVWIVGRGPLEPLLRARVRELGLEGVVELLGSRPPDEVRDLLERADLLAAPCVVAADGDRDTMPVVVKEALAMELPVVASDEVGLPEVVMPEWGRLVPPGDAAALAAAIEELLALPAERRAAMGRAGRAFVVEHCSLRRETERLASLIAAG